MNDEIFDLKTFAAALLVVPRIIYLLTPCIPTHPKLLILLFVIARQRWIKLHHDLILIDLLLNPQALDILTELLGFGIWDETVTAVCGW